MVAALSVTSEETLRAIVTDRAARMRKAAEVAEAAAHRSIVCVGERKIVR